MDNVNKCAPELSIVIPAYNAEKFLEGTLRSLEKQTVDRQLYQIIVVDDGSKDGTLQLCNRFAQEYANILVIHQENSGVSAARNAGIDAAEGKWITFVDSDDYVTEQYVETILKTSPESEYVVFDHRLLLGENMTEGKKWLTPYMQRMVEWEQLMFWICDNRLNAPWDKRFSRKLIHDHKIRFLQGVHMGEDFVFNFEYTLHIQKAYISDGAEYVHVENPEGLCNQKVAKTRLREYEIAYRVIETAYKAKKISAELFTVAKAAFLRIIARYAGKLHLSGYSRKEIAEHLHGSKMVKEILKEKKKSFKNHVRGLLLQAKRYDLCAVLFRG